MLHNDMTLLGPVTHIFLFTIASRFFTGFRSDQFADQSGTGIPLSMNQVLVLLAVWAGAEPYWKMKSA